MISSCKPPAHPSPPPAAIPYKGLRLQPCTASKSRASWSPVEPGEARRPNRNIGPPPPPWGLGGGRPNRDGPPPSPLWGLGPAAESPCKDILNIIQILFVFDPNGYFEKKGRNL